MIRGRGWFVLVAAMVVAGGAGAAISRWDRDSEEYRWYLEVDARLGRLATKRGYPDAPEVQPPLPTAEERRAYLEDCLAAEADCLALYQKNPNRLSILYTWLEARTITDQAANDVLVDKLNEFPDTGDHDLPFLTENGPSLNEYIAQARRRATRRAYALTEEGVWDTERGSLSLAARDFSSWNY